MLLSLEVRVDTLGRSPWCLTVMGILFYEIGNASTVHLFFHSAAYTCLKETTVILFRVLHTSIAKDGSPGRDHIGLVTQVRESEGRHIGRGT